MEAGVAVIGLKSAALTLDPYWTNFKVSQLLPEELKVDASHSALTAEVHRLTIFHREKISEVDLDPIQTVVETRGLQ